MNITFLNYSDAVSGPDKISRGTPALIMAMCIGLIVIAGNIMVLIILGKHPNLLGNTRKFCMHLAVTDLGNGILIFSISIALLVQQFCTPVYMTLCTKFFTFATQGLVTANNCERYVGICKRPEYTRIMTKSNMKIILCLSWIYALVLTAILAIGQSLIEDQELCFYHLFFIKWVYSFEAASMFSISIVNIVLFGFIIIKARNFYSRVTPASYQGTSNTAMKNKAMRNSIRKGKIMGFVTGAFLLCWIPFNGFQVYFGMDEPVTDGILKASLSMYFLGTCNSIINPFIYVWQKEEFRVQCKKIIKCHKTQHDNRINPGTLRETQETAGTSRANMRNQHSRDIWTTSIEPRVPPVFIPQSIHEDSISVSHRYRLGAHV